MTSSADQTIAALRSGHDDLAARVRAMRPDDLTGPSGAREWDVSQVVSHLGSGAEINLAALDAAIAGTAAPDAGFNKSVWARWDAMTPAERAESFLRADEKLVTRYESLDPEARANLRVDLGFLPQPVDIAATAAFRLMEFALHAWDVKVGTDPAATVAPEAVPVLLDQVGLLLRFAARPEALGGRRAALAVDLTVPDRSLGLEFGDAVTLTDAPARPDGVLRAPAEAFVRLVTGRLAPEYTPATVTVTGGPVDLDDLRRVFPGF
ncbi:maleylpyruvate isomerase family mycothiol-dependent enzyme [Planosporangium sp. 12N6]|uniref:maleylpyruvate isomerase family mycothiol-dependent enzyme n=1 Tax=Planosporangium spinosum TaxID=3402278 RepID=UPI003CF52C17